MEGQFRRPKWCSAPRSPERHKSQLRALGNEAESSDLLNSKNESRNLTAKRHLIASLLLVAMPGAPSSFLLLLVMASNLIAKEAYLIAMASNLLVMASNLLAGRSDI